MGIVETAVETSPTPRKELLRWCELLGVEVNQLLDEAPQLEKYLNDSSNNNPSKD
jgi:arsenate reductase-like glutaredoxin family protein